MNMAHIKCIYHRPVCEQMWEPGVPFNECPYSFSEYNDHCSCEQYHPRKSRRYSDYTCDFYGWEKVRFEKDAKSYELDETYLTIGKRVINRINISLLEIDGEVIIKEED